MSDGGRHPIGSYNRLIGLQDGAYIELLSFYEPSRKHYWWDAVYCKGGGLIDFCMATNDIRADYAVFEAQGVEMSALVGLSRVRFDGYQLSWLNNEIYGRYQGLVPFIFEDETPREERVPKENKHANGVTGIDTITLAASDIDLAQGIMNAVLSRTGESTRDEELNASGVVYQVGAQRLEYLTADDESSPVYAHIARNRPVPYRIRFKTSGEKRIVDPYLAAGVHIDM